MNRPSSNEFEYIRPKTVPFPCYEWNKVTRMQVIAPDLCVGSRRAHADFSFYLVVNVECITREGGGA